MRYAVVTFGCRVNQADSLGFEEQLLARGGVPGDADQADLVVVNTCSVTASADQAARQTIRRIARTNPAAKIVVTGCYATRAAEEIARLPVVLRVVPNDAKSRLVSDLEPAPHEPMQTTADRFGRGDGSCGAALEPGVAGRTAFTLRVQTGCAEKCSYCIIPVTRGAPRSVPIPDVLEQVDRVAAAGFKEIVLTGVHLGSYGRDLDPPASLFELLERLTTTRGMLFRISSLEPMDCTPSIVELVATAPCFAPHFHLPLQHASNGMLAAMSRPYTIEYYRALAATIRARIPAASIGSDVIVGFPGETDDDFGELSAYLSSSPLTHVHVFPYSDRPGTAAAGRADKVHGSVVRDRARIVRDIGLRLAGAFRASQIGTVHRGLTIDDGSTVVTGNFLKLRIPPGRSRNEWVDVRVTGVGMGEVKSAIADR
jgi:threonylcarbamoyladenosine tRNA methylthiotransferase MtaB